MIQPYYQDNYVTLYKGDSRLLLPDLMNGIDLLLTDPPYPDYHLDYGDTFSGHPSQKPVKLLKELITYGRGNSIIDPFMGSGSTAVAAKALGKKCIGIEYEEVYCEMAAIRCELQEVEE